MFFFIITLFAEVTAESQRLHLTVYIKYFEKVSSRSKGNRGKHRPTIDEWRQQAARAALFVWTMQGIKCSTSMPVTMQENRFQQFAEGDFNQELDAWLHSQPQDVSYKSTSIWNECHTQHALLLEEDANDVLNDAQAASEKADDEVYKALDKR